MEVLLNMRTPWTKLLCRKYVNKICCREGGVVWGTKCQGRGRKNKTFGSYLHDICEEINLIIICISVVCHVYHMISDWWHRLDLSVIRECNGLGWRVLLWQSLCGRPSGMNIFKLLKICYWQIVVLEECKFALEPPQLCFCLKHNQMSPIHKLAVAQ